VSSQWLQKRCNCRITGGSLEDKDGLVLWTSLAASGPSQLRFLTISLIAQP